MMLLDATAVGTALGPGSTPTGTSGTAAAGGDGTAEAAPAGGALSPEPPPPQAATNPSASPVTTIRVLCNISAPPPVRGRGVACRREEWIVPGRVAQRSDPSHACCMGRC